MFTEREIHMLMDLISGASDLDLNYSSPACMLQKVRPTKYPFSFKEEALELREIYRKLMLMSRIRSKDSYYNPEVK